MKVDWLKHAFAVDAGGPSEPNEAQQAIAERLCRLIVSRGLATPALVFLETSRPLNYVTAQGLHFFLPLLGALGDPQGVADFSAFLEQRGSIDWLCRRIEELSVPPSGQSPRSTS